tara:strand:+ start:4963 stop:6048 length:1086 start_codon:yes stop_codon:yes gene_type:complete
VTSIAIRSLRKEYGGQAVIPDFDLDILEGEFFTLLGPSGCGKTTLLRMIAGFNSIDAGTISFDGVVVNDQAPSSRDIGMVFQSYALFPQMTAAKNVAFGLQTRKVSRSESGERVDAALDSMRIVPLRDRLPGAMSGGQQQRVALARALVIRPAVLLMDEPLSNLDAKLRVEMRDVIRGAQIEAGITTVYVTHDQEEAMAVSDRIAVMNLGVVQQVGSPAEIYRNPANRFVAEFIGKTNLLEREVVQRGGSAMLDLGDNVSIDVSATAGAGFSGRVHVSVRPEAVRAGKSGISAEVIEESFLGSHSQVRAELASGEIVEFLEFSRRDSRWERGEKVTLEVDTELLNYFDFESGMSIMSGSVV